MNYFFRVSRVLLFFVCLILLPTFLYAQSNGSIHGKITDDESGESLVGISVLLEGTTKGAATDLDGKYLIKAIPAGTYTLKISGVGYTSKSIMKISIDQGKNIELNFTLTQESFNIKEVVITADEIHSTESAILTQRKRESSISDGISSEQIKRAPDATSGDALRRVTGLTLVDNKFVYVRGVTDRYNGTTLDGATVASTEAGKKSFSFDLLPANLIENISVIKSATPDLPGDFSGGLVQLNTLDIPSKRVLKVTLAQATNNVTTSNDITLSQSSSGDWLGLDDGSREYPGDQANQNDIARKATNNWGPSTFKAPTNTSFSLNYGDHIEFSDEDANSNQLGFISALSYKNAYQNNQDEINDVEISHFHMGGRSYNSVLWGALANLSYKFSGLNKISFKNNFNQSGENMFARYNSIDYADSSALMNNQYTIMNWTQRSTYTGQLIGDHTIPSLAGTTVQWRATVSSSRRDDPDRKQLTFYRPIEIPEREFYPAVNNRSWSNLNERTYSFGSDVTVPISGAKLKVGTFVDSKKENYRIRYFNIEPDFQGGFSDSLAHLPLDEIYAPENFGPGKYKFRESSGATDSYYGDQEIVATYGMIDIPFTFFSNKFRFVGGVRIENANQNVNVPKTLNPDGPVSTTSKHNADVLPSFNLTYLLNDKINIRAAYSNSLNRPEIRELARTAFYDFVKREMNGGNPELGRAYVRNYDLRAEYYPNIGELIAVSYFAKNITDAIEEKYHQAPTKEKSPENSPGAKNSGWEVEARKSLDFLGNYGSNFFISGNYTRIFSEVEIYDIEPNSNSSNTTYYTYSRQMQGQSPYTVNLSILFTEPNLGTSLSVLYNKFGRRIETVGFLTIPDLYEEARESIDFSISQPFSNLLEAKFTVKNLTNQEGMLTRSNGSFSKTNFGQTFSLSLALNY